MAASPSTRSWCSRRTRRRRAKTRARPADASHGWRSRWAWCRHSLPLCTRHAARRADAAGGGGAVEADPGAADPPDPGGWRRNECSNQYGAPGRRASSRAPRAAGEPRSTQHDRRRRPVHARRRGGRRSTPAQAPTTPETTAAAPRRPRPGRDRGAGQRDRRPRPDPATVATSDAGGAPHLAARGAARRGDRAAPIGALFAVSVGLLAVAAGCTPVLGVLHGAGLSRAANTEQVTTVYVAAERGTITDRHGTLLAITEAADDISADPKLVSDPTGRRGRAGPPGGELADDGDQGPERAQRPRVPRKARAGGAGEGGEGAGASPGGDHPDHAQVYPRNSAAQVLGTMGQKGGLGGIGVRRQALLHGAAGVRRPVIDAHGQPISITNFAASAGSAAEADAWTRIQQCTEAVLYAAGEVFTR